MLTNDEWIGLVRTRNPWIRFAKSARIHSGNSALTFMIAGEYFRQSRRCFLKITLRPGNRALRNTWFRKQLEGNGILSSTRTCRCELRPNPFGVAIEIGIPLQICNRRYPPRASALVRWSIASLIAASWSRNRAFVMRVHARLEWC